MFKFCVRAIIIGWGFFFHSLLAAPIHIVAAENFYGEVAKEIGGEFVDVTNVMADPNMDPHLFSIKPKIAQAIVGADLVIYSGIGYDDWIKPFLNHSSNEQQKILIVSQLMNKKEGDNPHIWYDPNTMPRYAQSLMDYLINKDPNHQEEYHARLNIFNRKFKIITAQVSQIQSQHSHVAVIATEPVFSYMATALGFDMKDTDFQLSITNNIDPTPSEMQNFEDQLKNKRVQILFYNKQVTSPLTEHLRSLATKNNIPSLGITELLPASETYIQWMSRQLKQVSLVLSVNHASI